MASVPKTQYAKRGDLHIAYQVTGSGPLDLVFVPGFVSHLEYQWEHPWSAHFFERLGSFSRLIRFDKRGTGLSDRVGGIPRSSSEWTMCERSWAPWARSARRSSVSPRAGRCHSSSPRPIPTAPR